MPWQVSSSMMGFSSVVAVSSTLFSTCPDEEVFGMEPSNPVEPEAERL
jgi:hypothetical protein